MSEIIVSANVEPDNEAPPVTPQRIMSLPTKFGRNDLCPCGSGKKVKRCHNQAIKDARAFQVYFHNEARVEHKLVDDVLKERFG